MKFLEPGNKYSLKVLIQPPNSCSVITIIMSIVPSGTWVVYNFSPAFSAPGNKPEITATVLPTFVQCSLSP
jgi:hypothetical protein